MKELKTTLPVGVSNQGMDLYATIQVEGEEPHKFKCKSFLGNFITSLHAAFYGGRTKKPITPDDDILSIEDIDIVNGDEVRIRSVYTGLNSSNYDLKEWDEPEPTQIHIFNFDDVFPGLTGTYYMDDIGTDLFYPVDENGNRVTTTNTSNVNNVNRDGLLVLPQHKVYSHIGSSDAIQRLNQWIIQIGYGTDPVKASDQFLSKQIGYGSGKNRMTQSGMNYSVQTTDKPTTRMVLTKTFTNNSGEDIEINEVGIYDASDSGADNTNGYDFIGILLVRDVLGSTQTVPDGKTITIDYEIVFELSPDTQDTDTDGTNGGFVNNFLSLLRLRLSNYDYGRTNYFNMAVGGQRSILNQYDYASYDYGVLVGTDNTYTSMTNDTLIAKINHGDEDGELWYHGMNFEDPVVDDVNNEAYFEVFRIFENRGSTNIVISEMGLAGNDNNSTQYTVSGSAPLLARTALAPADQFTVAPGEFVKVTYQIKAIV